jgi:hypothetical protein
VAKRKKPAGPKYTPGPWHVYPATKCVADEHDCYVMEASFHRPHAEAMANAQLAAAAPDLLAVAEAMIAAANHISAYALDERMKAVLQVAKSAVAKATGGAA